MAQNSSHESLSGKIRTEADDEPETRSPSTSGERTPSSTPENEVPHLAPDAEPPSEAPIVDSRPKYSIFTTWEKRSIVLGAAMGAFFSPLTAQIYFPALNIISKDLGVTTNQINLTVTTYMIFQGVTPMFVGSFADATGRRPAFIFCFIVYIAANIGCALAPNYAALLVLRMLQSAGSSTTVALCQAVVSDIVTSGERGQYVGWTTVPVILAPSLGPVLGGLFSQYLGWRWIFWFLTIAAGFVSILFAFFMPETCRAIVGDGSIRPHPYYRTIWQLIKDAIHKRKAARAGNDLALQRTNSRLSTKQRFRMKRPNPLNSLVILFEKEMFILLIYSSLVFAGFYAIATALPAQMADLYGFDDLIIGLMYLPMGVGSIVAAFAMGTVVNWNYRRYCRKLNIPFDRQRQQDLTEFPIERARLELCIPMMLLFAAESVAWGWAIQYRAPLAVPIVLMFIVGISVIGFSNSISTLIVDINPGHAGAAVAANNLTRCLIGAAASAVINPMISGVGSGWSFTIFAFIYLAGAPVLWIIMRNGIKWRKANQCRKQKRLERKERKRERRDGEQQDQDDDAPAPAQEKSESAA
ncbi:major facilitator superfamily transporter [Whalleya microplaca]|nr:major facilitator superfamily transporter [Whalleya microplaca]